MSWVFIESSGFWWRMPIVYTHDYTKLFILQNSNCHRCQKKIGTTYLDRFGNDHNNQIYCSICINFAKSKKNITLSIIHREISRCTHLRRESSTRR